MANQQSRKSIDSTLNKRSIKSSEQTSKQILCSDKQKVIQCHNRQCFAQIFYTENVVLIRCDQCFWLNCMLCLNVHENYSCRGPPDYSNLEHTLEDRTKKIMELADNAEKMFNYAAALIHYSEAIAIEPELPMLYYSRCICLKNLENHELAIDDAMKAIALNGQHIMSYYAVLECYIALGSLTQLENFIEKCKTIAPLAFTYIPKLDILRVMLRSIESFPSSTNYNDMLQSVEKSLHIATHSDEINFMKMRLYVILKLPVTEKMVEYRTNKYIARFCNKSYLDLLQLYYNDKLKECMETALEMMNLLPKRYSFIENILNLSSRFNIDFDKVEKLCFLNRFPEATCILRNLLGLDVSNREVNKRVVFKLKGTEGLNDPTKYSLIITEENHNPCERKEKEALQAYMAKDFRKAHTLYSEAYDLSSNLLYLVGRSECSRNLNNLEEALADALLAIKLNKSYDGGYKKAIIIALCQGDILNADKYIDAYTKNIANIDRTKLIETKVLTKLKEYYEKIQNFHENECYEDCLKFVNAAMNIATNCEKLENLKDECLVMIKRKRRSKGYN